VYSGYSYYIASYVGNLGNRTSFDCFGKPDYEQNTTAPAELQCIFRRISACHLTWKKKSIHNIVPERS